MGDEVIGTDSHVTFHYLLTDNAGAEIDNSTQHQPMQYIHGHNVIFPAVEEALSGLKEGEVIKITLAPDEAWGPHDPQYLAEVPREQFDFEIEVGSVVQGQNPEHGSSQPFMVTALDEQTVTLDGNHPLAGKTITFSIRIEAVRKATAQELAVIAKDQEPPTVQ
jgi:FKBP-type peptidyl-prolyl cis-trans isomerase SlyD